MDEPIDDFKQHAAKVRHYADRLTFLASRIDEGIYKSDDFPEISNALDIIGYALLDLDTGIVALEQVFKGK